MSELKKSPLISLLIKILVFVFLCLLAQHVIGAIFVLGWTYCLMRRRSLLLFSKLSEKTDQQEYHLHLPKLFQKEKDGEPGDNGGISFFRNLKVGFLGLFHTSLILAPGFILWMYAWYAGWQISFNKAYEYSSVGALLGILGIILFSLAMLYVPLAQARFAFTQQWNTFYQFRVNFKLISQQVKSFFLLALLVVLFAVLTNIFKTIPMFFSGMNWGVEDLNDEEFLAFLKNYFFIGTIIVMPLFFIIKRMGAKLFAKALVLCIQRKLLVQSDLTDFEWEMLKRFGLTEVNTEASSGLIWSLIKKNSSRLFKVQMLAITFAVWVTFCFQIFVSEFLNYHNYKGWLNQPLIQLPYFNYIPDHLTESIEEDPTITDPEEMGKNHPILK